MLFLAVKPAIDNKESAQALRAFINSSALFGLGTVTTSPGQKIKLLRPEWRLSSGW